MEIEKIEKDGKIFAVLPMEQYQVLIEDSEMLADITAFDTTMACQGEYFPIEFTMKLSEAYHAGKSLIPLWREYRGLTQKQLAQKADVPQSYLSMIENGKKPGSTSTMNAIAKTLGVILDDLV